MRKKQGGAQGKELDAVRVPPDRGIHPRSDLESLGRELRASSADAGCSPHAWLGCGNGEEAILFMQRNASSGCAGRMLLVECQPKRDGARYKANEEWSSLEMELDVNEALVRAGAVQLNRDGRFTFGEWAAVTDDELRPYKIIFTFAGAAFFRVAQRCCEVTLERMRVCMPNFPVSDAHVQASRRL